MLRDDCGPVGVWPGESVGRPGAADPDNPRVPGRLVDDAAGRGALAVGDAPEPGRSCTDPGPAAGWTVAVRRSPHTDAARRDHQKPVELIAVRNRDTQELSDCLRGGRIKWPPK